MGNIETCRNIIETLNNADVVTLVLLGLALLFTIGIALEILKILATGVFVIIAISAAWVIGGIAFGAEIIWDRAQDLWFELRHRWFRRRNSS